MWLVNVKKVFLLLAMLVLACPALASGIAIHEDNNFIYLLDKRFAVFENIQLYYKLDLLAKKDNQNSFYNVKIFQYITNYNISVHDFSEFDKNGNNVFANTKKYEIERILQPNGELFAKKILKQPRKCVEGVEAQSFDCIID